MEEQVILVDKNDTPIGKMGKLEVHQKGLLHRAISIFIFNSKGEMLIQKRALHKYHTPGLWSNTACSHPRNNEIVKRAAERRLKEEMGITCDLFFSFSFMYKAKFESGLIENELDHVYIGFSDEKPMANPTEVCDFRYISEKDLKREIKTNPNDFTPWFKICYERAIERKLFVQKEILIA